MGIYSIGGLTLYPKISASLETSYHLINKGPSLYDAKEYEAWLSMHCINHHSDNIIHDVMVYFNV